MAHQALMFPAQEALELPLGEALRQASIGLFVCDGALRYTSAQGALPGFPIAEALGRRDDEFLPAGAAAKLLAFKERIMGADVAAAEELLLPLGGRVLSVEARGEPLRDGKRTIGLTLALIDLTARWGPEGKARDAAAPVRPAAPLARAALLLHDGERIRDVDEAFTPMFLLSRDEAKGRDPLAFLAAPTRALARAAVASLTDAGLEGFGLRADGSIFPVEITLGRLAQEGQTLGVMHVRDLTGHQQAEIALRESEERYRALAAATREGVIIHDGSRLVEVNDAFCRLHGTTREQAIGRPTQHYIAAEARAAFLRTIGSGVTAPFEAVARREDGSTFPIEAAGQPIVYQGRSMRVATIRDLTGQRAAEAALRESEERFRGFAEASSDVLWVVDTQTRAVEYLSPAFETVWGVARDGILQDPRRWTEFVHPADRATVSGALERTLTGESLDLEYRIIRPDGTLRWIRDTGFPIRDQDGRVRRAAGLAHDITRRKEDENRQKLLLGELNHRVKNTLATVQSIARQTLRHCGSPSMFRDRFEDRLLALSHTHNLLTGQQWEHASLRSLLVQELSPYGEGRCLLDGPQDVNLAPRAVVALGMALHELTTNAAKYGALSVPIGHIEVRWNVEDAPVPRLHLEWHEVGGPPITAPPIRKGFGSMLLARGVTAELAGAVDLAFEPEGLVARIEIPLDHANAPKAEALLPSLL